MSSSDLKEQDTQTESTQTDPVYGMMPTFEDPFTLETEDGVEIGPLPPTEDWIKDEATNIAYAHDPTGSPVILRILAVESIAGPNAPVRLLCIDNDGGEIEYVVRKLPDNTLPIVEPTPGPTHEEDQ